MLLGTQLDATAVACEPSRVSGLEVCHKDVSVSLYFALATPSQATLERFNTCCSRPRLIVVVSSSK